MLASVFNKSRPFNYALIAGTFVLFYFMYLLKDASWTANVLLIGQKIILFLLLVSCLLLVNFITRKNTLTRDNTYAMFLFMLFLILFPTILVNVNIIISLFFTTLALRRLISLQSLVTPKEKIFDASFWIFMASLFHFWSILFIILVFISIIFHVSRDYRNWVIPFIAFFAVLVLYSVKTMIFNESLINTFTDKIRVSFDFTYFENIYQNIALAVFSSVAVLFAITQITAVPSRPLNMQASYKKIIFCFLIGVAIYILSADKNNSFLAFTFLPLSILGANYLESQQNVWFKESLLGILVVITMFLFFSQL